MTSAHYFLNNSSAYWWLVARLVGWLLSLSACEGAVCFHAFAENIPTLSRVFTDKAKVVKSLSEVYLPYGRSGILDCHFLSNPPLTNIRWEKDGFLFDPYNVPGVFYRKNGSLYFTKVQGISGFNAKGYLKGLMKGKCPRLCTQPVSI
jgi:hypothetical protein